MSGAQGWFRALGTEVWVQASAPDDTLTAATGPVSDPVRTAEATRTVAAVLDDVDRAYSRFRADSELVRAQARPGEAVEVSALLAGAVRVALQAAEQTEGLVTPTLGGVLAALGYDRTFALLGAADPGHLPCPPPPPDAWRAIGLAGCTLTVPAGITLDLGATGKAYAADLAARIAAERVGTGVVVSVGGDVSVAGTTALAGWPLVVGDSSAELAAGRRHARIRLRHGGVATSSTAARRWGHQGRLHHLIDPRSGLPVDGPWRTVAAVGRSAVAANTASTAAFLLGAAAPEWLTERGVAALLVRHDGTHASTPGWPAMAGAGS